MTRPGPQLGHRRPGRTRAAAGVGLMLVAAFGGPAARGQELPVVVHTAEGQDLAGNWTKLGPGWSVRLGGPEPQLVPGESVLSLRRRGLELPPFPDGPQVVFSNGDRLTIDPAAAPGLADEKLTFRPGDGIRAPGSPLLTVPVSYVAVVWLAPPRPVRDAEAFLRGLREEARAEDRVALRNGDVIRGAVTGLDPRRGCVVQTDGEPTTVPLDRLAYVAFSTELLARPRLRGPYALAVLRGGSRLSLTEAALETEGGKLLGKTPLRTGVEVPPAAVAALYLYQGKATYLSDLTPSNYSHTPFLATDWPYTKDAAVGGGSLELADGTHDKGLGMHSRSELTFPLGGRYQRFEAQVALDPVGGRRGDVQIMVLVDGKEQALDRAGQLHGAGDQPLLVAVDVTGAKELTIRAGFGRGGDVQDRVNWADARLID